MLYLFQKPRREYGVRKKGLRDEAGEKGLYRRRQRAERRGLCRTNGGNAQNHPPSVRACACARRAVCARRARVGADVLSRFFRRRDRGTCRPFGERRFLRTVVLCARGRGRGGRVRLVRKGKRHRAVAAACRERGGRRKKETASCQPVAAQRIADAHAQRAVGTHARRTRSRARGRTAR